MTTEEIADRINRHIQQEKVPQSLIAKRIGINQGHLSRIVRGDFKRLSPNVIKLCKYANINVQTIALKKRKKKSSIKLVEVLEEIWDGTPQHEQALIKVIRSLRHLN